MPTMGDFAKAYKLEDSSISDNTGVVRGSTAGTCKVPTSENLEPLGVVRLGKDESDVLRGGIDFTGKPVTVELNGIVPMVASGAISYGDDIILAIDGKAKARPLVAGTYYVLGKAEGDAEDGDSIDVLIEKKVITIS